MAQALIDIARPEQDQTRTELTLARIAREWSRQPSGRRFTEALIDFLRAKSNRNTLRSYSFSILEFFGWYERDKGRMPTPDLIRRADAAEYDTWLRQRQVGLREWQLRQDPSRRFDATVYALVARQPGVRLDTIQATLRVADRISLAKRLACLVDVKTLRRTPSIAQIRRGDVIVPGLTPELARRVGLEVPVPHGIFQYFVPEDTTAPGERASSISTRLSALSGLWNYLMQSGENVGSATPLLRVNIWGETLKKAQRQAPSHQKASRAAKTPGLSLFERLVATTYLRRYGGGGALQMAAAQMRPQDVVRPSTTRQKARETFADLRDRAMMLLLGQTGVRAEELQLLRRDSLSGDMLSILGKGGRKRVLRVPPATIEALDQVTRKLVELAHHQARYYPGSTSREQLLRSDAPLLPPVGHWGKNAGADTMQGLTRAGIAMMLRRRAIAAGIEPGTPDFARVHPHGLRHLFAKTAIESGTGVNIVQAILGHASGAQTLRYMEEHEPGALIAKGFAQAPRAPVAPPPAPRPMAPPQRPRAGPARPPAPPVPPLAPAAPEPPVGAPTPPPPREPPEPRAVRLVEMMPTEVVVPQAERLVGLGEAPSHEPETTTVDEEAAIARLQRIYEGKWGERGDRSRLGTTEVAVTSLLAELGIADELEAITGAQEIVEAPGVGAERLVHAYVGKSSGLVWWAGPTGKLSPELPVMSPAQVGECGAEHQDAVCEGLVNLWRRWMAGEGRGPTGAAALVGWVAEALEVATQVGAEVEARGGRWVPSDAPWEETSGLETPRLVFREQEPGAVVAWFEDTAWQFRRARTRGKKVLDEPYAVPDYYAEGDPIGQLDDAERAELLDWIAALSGQQPRDQRQRFNGVSRADLARLIAQMCLYDQQHDLLGQIRAEVKSGTAKNVELRAVERSAKGAAEQVNRLARTFGAPESFSIEGAATERIKQRRAGVEKDREPRQDFYMRLIGELFGPEAAADPVLRLVALCGRTPLGEQRYRDLFNIDWLRRTLVHDRSFAKEFASDTGAHSECVARRMARDLWEMRKRHLGGARQRALERPDELVEMVEAMRAYKVPCPESQERELRGRLGLREPLPVFRVWEASERAQQSYSRPMAREAIEAEQAEFAERYGAQIGAAYRGTFLENHSRGRLALPTPIHLVAAVLLR